LLAQALAHAVRESAPEYVVAAPRRERDDEADRPRRVLVCRLGGERRRRGETRGSERGSREAAREWVALHGFPPQSDGTGAVLG
jgi:hypothetical protein